MGGNRGGARPGAGRKKTGKVYCTMSICGYSEDIEAIRIRAKRQKKTLSRYVLDILKRYWEQSGVE